MHFLSKLSLLLSFVIWPQLLAVEINEPEGTKYYFNGSLETENIEYRYGCRLEKGVENDYDGLLIIIDKTTDTVIDTVLYETGYLETILFIGAFNDGTYGVIIERIYVERPSLTYCVYDTLVMKINQEGQVIAQILIDHQLKEFHNHGSYLILNEISNDKPDLVLNSSLEITTLPEFETEYFCDFNYPFIGTATVNEVDVDKISLCKPGIYNVVITDGDYEFSFTVVLAPTVEGAVNGESYSEPIRIIVSCPAVELDGMPFVSGDVVAEPGDHKLIITGENGYQKIIDFRITPTVFGVEDQVIYSEPITISVNGIATLNGKLIPNGETQITENGDYELIMWIGAEKYVTKHFRLAIEAEDNIDEPNGNTFPFLETILGIVVMVGLFLVLKKK
ncbi:MAG: hypothetical protein WC479_03925 [Candidatus Izemoplasmatales bacterium]|jgi:hypothetical protein|nr:hypothetical protein [Candidatus Izemoplasmatales bacterium]MDD3864951.1 hypothetical protein [Candidatus Izemoplasmatales bacterium]